MVRRLFVIVALIIPCLVSVAYAADNELSQWNTSQLVGAEGFDVAIGKQSLIVKNSETGLHGRYITTSSRCDICHGLNDKGEVDLSILTATKDGACDWCHGSGSASSCYIAMDNNDDGTIEYDTGHSHGFGVDSGKWKAPDDTYPAFTPSFWRGGLSCFDCHTAHANPLETLGHTASGNPIYGVLDPGFNSLQTSSQPGKPSIYRAGRWFLKKNPDPEYSQESGAEIDDRNNGNHSAAIPFPVNKIAIDWDDPVTENPLRLTHSSVPCEKVISVNELCIDCHDGNAGLHDVPSLIYSEELALRGGSGLETYTEAYGHDAQPGSCSGQSVFNPEDDINNGPSCRSCHRGNGDCDLCHSADVQSKINWPREAYAQEPKMAEIEREAVGNGKIEADTFVLNNYRQEYSANWDPSWRSFDISCSPECMSVGLSWPHRTLAWKMLKNELFGIDLDGEAVEPGARRELLAKQLSLDLEPAHDLDSVCLDCHNPTVWQPGVKEAFMRGLP